LPYNEVTKRESIISICFPFSARKRHGKKRNSQGKKVEIFDRKYYLLDDFLMVVDVLKNALNKIVCVSKRSISPYGSSGRGGWEVTEWYENMYSKFLERT